MTSGRVISKIRSSGCSEDAGGARGYSAPALEKGLAIIELLAETPEPLSTRQIAERLGRSKSEIFRMVYVLVERGYLKRDLSTDELMLSNRLFELGMRTPRSRQLAELAVPAMERLSEQTGCSSHLVVVNRGETVVIATVAGGADISFTLRLGYRRPALDATSGRIIMAFQEPAQQERLIAESLAAAGSNSTPDSLIPDLNAIRQAGHLIAESHDVVGVTDIGAPVLDRTGRAVAGIVIPYLNRHRERPRHGPVLAALANACAQVSEGLAS